MSKQIISILEKAERLMTSGLTISPQPALGSASKASGLDFMMLKNLQNGRTDGRLGGRAGGRGSRGNGRASARAGARARARGTAGRAGG